MVPRMCRPPGAWRALPGASEHYDGAAGPRAPRGLRALGAWSDWRPPPGADLASTS